MSNSVENRIVNMQFKNTDFQKGVSNTLSSLGKLKEGLNFSGSAKGIADVQGAINKTNFGPLGGAIEGISAKFAAMATVGITALANITNKAVDAGINIGKALTIDAKSAGFTEYELKLGSIQTIMAGTGDDLQKVNGALDELNQYADETIYSFSDMTENIGKFTNAGVDLDKSVGAIKGVANVAALSGANSNEASRAMYNFSQALSIGYVGLMDWKSIELANMGTSEFREQLIGSAEAMGTLKKTGDGTWETLKGTEVTVENFRNTLNDQWLTSEALTQSLNEYADANTEIGARATAAATEVKTFSHLLDTLKEGAGSGWAQTFEVVIGDFEEAKQLWTSVNEEVGGWVERSAKARNKVLSDWKALGGRDDLKAALGNIWSSIKGIIGPIQKAFREIFPKTTGKQLASITAAFRRFTEIIKIGGETSKNIGRTFKGLFAILGIGAEILKGIGRVVWEVIKTVFSAFSGGNGGVLEMTANFGDLLVGVHEFLVEGEGIKNFFDNIISGSNTALKPLVAWFKKISEAVAGLFKGDFSGFSNVLGSVQATLEDIQSRIRKTGSKMLEPIDAAIGWIANRIGDLREMFGDLVPDIGMDDVVASTKIMGADLEAAGEKAAAVWGGVKNAIQSVSDFLAPMVSRMSSFLGTMTDKIFSWFENMTMAEGVSLLNTGFFIAAYLAVKKFMDNMNGILKPFGDFVKGMTGIWDSVKAVFDEVTNTLKIMQTDVKANIILKIAIAVGVLAASLWVLSKINTNDLIKAMTALGILFGIILGTLAIVSKIDLAEKGGLFKATAALILMSVAVILLASAVSKLAKLSWEEIAKGLVGVGVILGALILFTKFAEADKGGISSGLGLMLMAIAVNLLATAVSKLGEMDTGQLLKGLGALTVVIGGMTVLSAVMGKAKGSILSASTGMLIMSAALLVMYGAIKLYSNMNYGEFAKGLGLIAITVVAVGLAMKALPEKDILKSAAAMAILAGSLILLMVPIKIFAGMSPSTLVKVGVALGVLLAAVAIAANAMKTAMPGAAAMTVMAVAIGLMAASLLVLSMIPWEALLIAVGIIAALFVVLGAAAAIIGPLSPMLMALAIAVGILGAAMLLAGLGFLAFATGFGMIAAVGVAGVAVLIAAFEGIISLIPLFAEQIGLGFIAFAKVISDAGPPMVAALVTILQSLLTAIETVVPQAVSVIGTLILAMVAEVRRLVPQIVELVAQMLLDFLNKMNTYMPQIVAAMYSILLGILGEMRTYIPQVVDAVADMMVDILDAISSRLNDIINAAADLIIGFLDGIERKIPVVIRKARRVVRTFIDEMATAIEQDIPWIVGRVISMGSQMIQGLIDELKAGASRAADAAIGVVSDAWNGAMSWLGIRSPSRKFMEIGYWSDQGLAKGLTDNVGVVEDASTKTAQSAVDVLRKTLGNISSVVEGDLNLNPKITPVVDLSEVNKNVKKLNTMMPQSAHVIGWEESVRRAQNVQKVWDKNQKSVVEAKVAAAAPVEQKTEINYVQNNNSPKALSSAEIYRQTRSQLSTLRRELG